jgi:hypothetical protein
MFVTRKGGYNKMNKDKEVADSLRLIAEAFKRVDERLKNLEEEAEENKRLWRIFVGKEK